MRIFVSLLCFVIVPTLLLVLGGNSVSPDEGSAQEASGVALALIFGALALYAIGFFLLLKRLFHIIRGTKPNRTIRKEPPRFNSETDDRSEYYEKHYSDRRQWLNSQLKSRSTEKEREVFTDELAELNDIFSAEMETKQRGGSPRLTPEERRRVEKEEKDKSYGPKNKKIICKLCGEKGTVRVKSVRTKETTKEYGVIGAKGSIKEIRGNRYSCGNCGGDWFEQTV